MLRWLNTICPPVKVHFVPVTFHDKQPSVKSRNDLIAEAHHAINVDRAATHGKAEDSFATIAGFWSTYLGVEVKPYQVGQMMVLFKVARTQTTPAHRDHYTDQIGYAALSGEIAMKEQE